MSAARSFLGLFVAFCSLPFAAIAYFVFIVGGLVFALAEGIKGAGEWIAK